jgi:hypothetical protein
MLDALGTPEEIVAASGPAASGTGPTGRRALTFGILALVLLPISHFFFLFGFFAIPFGVTAVVLGVRARRFLRSAGEPTSTATAATVTGGVAVVIPVLLFTFLVGVRTINDSPEPVTDQLSPVPAPTTSGHRGG